MAALTIQVVGLDPLMRNLNNGKRATDAEMRTAMTASLLLLEGTMRRKAPRDTGRLQGSITHSIEGGGAGIVGRVGPSVRYGYWVEHGRRAGRQPPIGAIAGWAKRHGVHPFTLARAIGRRGTRAQPFVAPTLAQDRGKVSRLFQQCGARIAATIAGR